MSSCFSPPLRLLIAMPAVYPAALWITPSFRRTYPDFHHGLLREYLVDLVPHMLTARRLQVPHRALHVGMTEPLLNCTQIDPSPQRPCRKRRSELVEPEVFFIQLRTLRHSLQAVEKIELGLAASGREDQTTALV